MRGLNKPSTDTKEEEKSIPNGTTSPNLHQFVDENGI